MNDFDDDEIIDLEDELEEDIEEEQPDDTFIEIPPEKPQHKEKEISPFSFNKNNFFNKKNNDETASKLQNLNKKNNLFPTNNLTGNGEENNQADNKVDEAIDKVKTKVGAKAIEAASGGAINGKVAEELADAATQLSRGLTNKVKKYTIIAACVAALFIILFCVLLIDSSGNSDLGQNTYTYVTGEATEEELIDQLEYYGYCKDEYSCKQKGVYKFYIKLKEIYDEYQKDCPAVLSNDKPCGVTLNTALIIETINYYQNSDEVFDVYYSEENEDDDTSLLSWISTLFQKIRNKNKIDAMLNDVEELAIAQAEYVKETCENKTYYYYQISFNKYVSYLKYGNTSSHPNYSGQPVEIENEICQGQTNDNISTSYDSNGNTSDNNPNQDSNTMGQQIVNYAVQFVGNPYVWGGESLTNGVDCSGFTMQVFAHFGIILPHNSTSQANYGTNIGTDLNVAEPGDLIVYNKNSDGIGHVAIYMGNNKIVHAKGKDYGIVITNDANKRSIKAIVRLWR